MSTISVDEIQGHVASLVDQDSDTSAISTDDYALRLNYINRALKEWSEISDWQTLYKEFNSLVSTSAGNASIVLPNDFRKLASFPRIGNVGTADDAFVETLPQEDGQYGESDHRVWVLGNPRSGYILRVFGASLVSGASVKVPYYASPQSLASPANIAEIPNPEYLVQKTVAYLWEGREDPRFPQAKAEAERILQNMIEHENVFGRAANYDTVKTVEMRTDFRIGRD